MIVTMSVWNRPAITELCLRRMAETKRSGTKIQAWDSASDYPPEKLYEWGADEVFRLRFRRNDQDNRAAQLAHFLANETDDMIYCVDNDAWHDSQWEQQLETLHSKYGGIVTLFNSANHARVNRTPWGPLPGGTSHIEETEDAVFRRTCGGISLCMHRDLLLEHFTGKLKQGYDWEVSGWTNRVCTSTQSCIAHLDLDGIHSGLNDGVDPGLNPTAEVKQFVEEYACSV